MLPAPVNAAGDVKNDRVAASIPLLEVARPADAGAEVPINGVSSELVVEATTTGRNVFMFIFLVDDGVAAGSCVASGESVDELAVYCVRSAASLSRVLDSVRPTTACNVRAGLLVTKGGGVVGIALDPLEATLLLETSPF